MDATHKQTEPNDGTTPRDSMPTTVQDITPYHWDGHNWIPAPLDHPAPLPGPVSVATFNILADCFPWYIRAAICSEDRFSALLERIQALDADVLGLNEVTAVALELLLSSRFVREHYFVSESPAGSNNSIPGAHGILLLSKLPVSALRLVRCEHRPAVIALLRFEGGPELAVCSVHTQAYQTSRNRAVRVNQMQEVTVAASALCASHVIMGDLNMHDPGEDRMLTQNKLVDLWTQTRGRSPGFTFDPSQNSMIHRYIPGEQRQMRLDRVLVSQGALWAPTAPVSIWGDEVLDASRELHLSDHFGLRVTIEPCDVPLESSPEAIAIVAENTAMPMSDYNVRSFRFARALAWHVPWLAGRVIHQGFNSVYSRLVSFF